MMPGEINVPPAGDLKDLRRAVSACVQCGCCSAYCAVSFLCGESPRKIMRFLQRDDLPAAAGSSFLKLCKQCQTCTLVCPQGVDVAEAMRVLVRHRFLSY